jgi:hypothetical protein
LSACTRSAIPRHGRPNAIAENEADDHAYQKLHFPLSRRQAKRKVTALIEEGQLSCDILGSRTVSLNGRYNFIFRHGKSFRPVPQFILCMDVDAR